MQVVIFFNGSRGLHVLNRLLTSTDVQVTAIVTPPTFNESSLANVLNVSLLEHLKIQDVNAEDLLLRLRMLHPDVFIIAGYSTIFKAPLLAVPTHGVLNLHAGRLPEYRGGSPLNWQLINGETKAGLSVIQVDEGIDTGPILAESTIAIDSCDTIHDLHAKANQRFPALVLEAVLKLKSKESFGRIQTDANAQYWHQRNDADGYLDFQRLKAIEVDRVIRAITNPYPGAYAYCGGQKVRLLAAQVPCMCIKGVPGRVCFIQGKGPYIICADQAILITDYQFETESNSRLKHGQYLR